MGDGESRETKGGREKERRREKKKTDGSKNRERKMD
jgi:hypothetical protein